ncbi:MAG: gephyrin-like molybdotransferase Glp [Candidatus Hodarchaeota archaeon]
MSKGGFGTLTSLDKAKGIFESLKVKLGEEEVPLSEADQRFLSRSIQAPISVPHFRKSAMDGYAVRSEDTIGATYDKAKTLKVIEVIHAGDKPSKTLSPGTCVEITTGAPLPESADSVLMVEYTESLSEDSIAIYKPVAPSENVIAVGSDIKQGSDIFSKGIRLDSRRLGVLSALGFQTIWVFRPLRVGLLSTGDEVVPPGTPLETGKIYDINSVTIFHALQHDGCQVVPLGIAKDDPQRLLEAIQEGIKEKADFVLLSGGSSLGAEDYVVQIIKENGTLLLAGVATKPGKPTIVGKIDEVPVIGLPGHPMSALSIYYVLVRRLIWESYNFDAKPIFVQGRLTRKVVSSLGRHQFLPVHLSQEEGILKVHPILKGSSAITGIATADGFIEISERTEVLESGKEVKVTLFDF